MHGIHGWIAEQCVQYFPRPLTMVEIRTSAKLGDGIMLCNVQCVPGQLRNMMRRCASPDGRRPYGRRPSGYPRGILEVLVGAMLGAPLAVFGMGGLACQSTFDSPMDMDHRRRDPGSRWHSAGGETGACGAREEPLGSVEMLPRRLGSIVGSRVRPPVAAGQDMESDKRRACSLAHLSRECPSSRNGPPTWPSANSTTEMSSSPRCPVNGETGETGLMMVPTRLGKSGAALARLLLGAACFRAAREEYMRTARRGWKAS